MPEVLQKTMTSAIAFTLHWESGWGPKLTNLLWPMHNRAQLSSSARLSLQYNDYYHMDLYTPIKHRQDEAFN